MSNPPDGSVTTGGLERTATSGRLLLVDDEPTILRSYGKALERAGHEVVAKGSVDDALTVLFEESFDCIVSDISLPGLGGLDLLSAAREHAPHVPVILMTGGPTVETAAAAVELGAIRYLVKPVSLPTLRSAVADAIRHHDRAELQRRAMHMYAEAARQNSRRAYENEAFSAALDVLWIAFQPLVSWQERAVFGYEALVRCADARFPSPGVLFAAAEELDRVDEIGRKVRAITAEAAVALPDQVLLFVNLHPTDLLDEDLYNPTSSLASMAHRVVLEITERARVDQLPDLSHRLKRLRGLGYRIAIDDLGAGYASLSTFAQLQAEVVKVDMELVQGVESDRTKLAVIQALLALCHKLETLVVMEGIETRDQLAVLVGSGADLLQGFLFAHPTADIRPVDFDHLLDR